MEKNVEALGAELTAGPAPKPTPADGSPENIRYAAGVLSYIESPAGQPLSALESIYSNGQAEDRVETIRFDVDNARVLYLADPRIGDPQADVPYFLRVLEEAPTLPDPPNVIVMSGLIAGDFLYKDKSMRDLLRKGAKSLTQQCGFAKQVFEKAAEAGVPTVYNLSDTDRHIAEDQNYSIFKRAMKAAGKSEQVDTPHWRLEQMREHPAWDVHQAFQLNVALPYSMKIGRTLRTAEEMKEETGVQVEEYFILYEAHRRLSSDSEEPEDSFDEFEYKDLVEVDKLFNTADLIFVDNVNMVLDDGESEYDIWIRDHLNFSDKTLYQNHMKTPMNILSGRMAGGLKVPKMLMTLGNHEGVGVVSRDSVASSANSFNNSTELVNLKASRSAAFTIPKRGNTTRNRPDTPGTQIIEHTSDGRLLVTPNNRTLDEKSHIESERTAIVINTDWQVGSPTARSDYGVAWNDILHTRVLPNVGKAAVLWTGDIVHGEIYPDFRHESQYPGLISVSTQKEFVYNFMRMIREDVPAEQLGKIMLEAFTPGNHEWHSGAIKVHGDAFTDYLLHMSDASFAEKGLAPRSKFYDAVETPEGEKFKSWTIVEQIAGHGIVARHFALDKMAGKGGGGNLPVYTAGDQLVGAQKLSAGIDLHLTGHWHHAQWAMLADKLGIVSGALAGESGYEWERGYRPVIGGTVLYLGGGLAPTIEFYSEQTLQQHKIKSGPFSEEVLNSERYFTDPGFNVKEHGPMMNMESPKSARQKKIIAMMLSSSQRTASTSRFPNSTLVRP